MTLTKQLSKVRAQRFSLLRKSWLLTQNQLARAVGVSPRTIYNLEQGLPPSTDTLRRVLRFYGLDVMQRFELFPDTLEQVEQTTRSFTSRLNAGPPDRLTRNRPKRKGI